MKNIIVMDSDELEGEEFRQALEEYTGKEWSIIVKNCNLPHGWKDNVKRYLKYIFEPLVICIHKKEYGDIVMWQQFFGIFFAFWCELFSVKKTNRVVSMMLIYKPKKGMPGKIYHWLFKRALHSKYIDGFTCGSGNEVALYNREFDLQTDKIRYIPWGIRDYSKEYDLSYDSNKYVLSAGRSNRDWDFLIQSLDGQKYNCQFVTSEPITATKNISIYKNIKREEYYQLLANSFCVVIAVDNPDISSGQLALIEALQFGKPVIATRSKGLTEEYLKHGYNGLIIEKNSVELRNMLETLYNDKDLYSRLVDNGRRYYEEYLSSYRMGIDVSRILLGKEA